MVDTNVSRWEERTTLDGTRWDGRIRLVAVASFLAWETINVPSSARAAVGVDLSNLANLLDALLIVGIRSSSLGTIADEAGSIYLSSVVFAVHQG